MGTRETMRPHQLWYLLTPTENRLQVKGKVKTVRAHKKDEFKCYTKVVPCGVSNKAIREGREFVKNKVWKGMKFGVHAQLMGTKREKLMKRLALTMGVQVSDEDMDCVKRFEALEMARQFALTVVRKTRGSQTEKILEAMRGMCTKGKCYRKNYCWTVPHPLLHVQIN